MEMPARWEGKAAPGIQLVHGNQRRIKLRTDDAPTPPESAWDMLFPPVTVLVMFRCALDVPREGTSTCPRMAPQICGVKLPPKRCPRSAHMEVAQNLSNTRRASRMTPKGCVGLAVSQIDAGPLCTQTAPPDGARDGSRGGPRRRTTESPLVEASNVGEFCGAAETLGRTAVEPCKRKCENGPTPNPPRHPRRPRHHGKGAARCQSETCHDRAHSTPKPTRQKRRASTEPCKHLSV